MLPGPLARTASGGTVDLPCSPPLYHLFVLLQALGKIPDTLVCAFEFIQLPTPKVGGTWGGSFG